MKEAYISELRPGDIVNKTVYGKNGMAMLESGTVLTEYYIERLRALGFMRISIKDRIGGPIVTERRTSRPPAAHEEIKSGGGEAEVTAAVQREIDRMKEDKLAHKRAEAEVRRFVESESTFAKLALPFMESTRFRRDFSSRVLEVASQEAIALELSVMMQSDPQLFSHSLQVALLSNVAGDVGGYDKGRLQNLTVGSLLFDVGMTRLPENLIKAKRQLTEEERQVVKQHTQLGYKVLSKLKEVPLEAARAALLHHERFNGGGYPLAFKGNAIPELAQLIGLADVYDALLSERPHRGPYPSNEAIEYLFAAGNYEFGIEMIQLFLHHIAVFPISSVVLLSSGQLGVVENTQNRLAHRPVVRIIREANGESTREPYMVDLNQSRNLVIVKMILSSGVAMF